MGEIGIVYNILVEPEGMIALEKRESSWEDNIKMYFDGSV
jgi:hypothetical protein